MRFCKISTGVLFILTATWCVAYKGVAFTSLAFVLGIVMIIAGAIAIFAYLKLCKGKMHLSYVLSDGIISVVLGMIVLANRIVTDIEIPLFFGMWIMFTGTSRLMTSLHIGKRRESMKKYLFCLGILDILAGAYMLFNSILINIPNIVLVAICFMLQGINAIASGIEMPKDKRRVMNNTSDQDDDSCNCEN